MCSPRLRLASTLALVALAGCAGCNRGGASRVGATLTVVTYGGGAYQEAHKKAFCEPFTEITGSPVDSIVWNAEYGKLKSMVESGRVPWDVVEVTAAQFARGTKEGNEGLFSPLSVKPHDGDFLPNTVSEKGAANLYWATVLAYKRSAFGNDPPATWRDFWNVTKYRGSRALYDDPRGNLEFALLADGVPKDKLYPLDVDRALRKLDELKPYVRVWWRDGTQPVQLLLSNQVDLTSAWSGRIYASEQARHSVGYSWQGAALELDYWVIPRGSANVDAASRFIAFASGPRPLAQVAELVGYGPVNRTALSFTPEKVRASLPTFPANWDVSFEVNADWWATNEEQMQIRWLSWKQK
jgi:putative spermidine/putrescine transport system substrate-binding protein